MDRLPPLKALRVFQVAAETGSFKAASERLFVTQAAVSQQIRLLEEHFAEALFTRLNREVQLTSAGKRLLPFIQAAFQSIEEGSRQLAADPKPNQLNITSLPSFAARWLIPRLGNFQKAYPDLSCLVTTSCDLHDFSDDTYDLAIRFGAGGFQGLKEKAIASDYVLPLCHPSLLKPGRKAFPLLIDQSNELTLVTADFKARFGKESQVVLRMSDSNLLMDAALNGQGVAPIRFSLAYEYIERGHLVCPLNIFWASPYTYFLVAPESHFERPKVSQFCDWIIEETSDIAERWALFVSSVNLQEVELKSPC